MAYSPQELSSLTQRALADPHVQQAWQEWQAFHDRTGAWSQGHSESLHGHRLNSAMRAAGMPEGTRVTFNAQGQPQISNYGLPGWAYPIIIGAATAGGLGAAGAFAGPTAGAVGGGGAAGGTLPASAVSPVGSLPAATTPFGAATAPGAATALETAGAAGGGGTFARIMRHLAPAAVPVGAAIGSRLAGGGNELPQELRDILALQKQRMEAQGPLYASILQLAQQRLPTSVQNAQLPGQAPSQPAVEALARRRTP